MKSPFIVHKSGEQEESEIKQPLSSENEQNAQAEATPLQDNDAAAANNGVADTTLSVDNDTIVPTSLRRAKPRRAVQNMVIYLILLPICASMVLLTLEIYMSGEGVLPDVARVMLLIAGTLIFMGVLLTTLKVYHQKEKDQLLLKELFDGSPSARLVTDIREQPVYENDRFASLLRRYGVKDEGLGALYSLFGHDDASKTALDGLIEHARKGEGGNIELRALSRDEAQKAILGASAEDDCHHDEEWYQIDAQPVAGRAGFVQWRVEDVSQRHSIEHAVRQERAKLLDFMDNAPVGFFSLNEDGRFSFVNETLARWLGDEAQNFAENKNLHSYFAEPPEGARPFDLTEDGGAKQVVEVTMTGAKGREFQASINQTVVHEEDGRIRTRGVVHDLTSERAIHQALQDSEVRFQRFFEEAPLGIVLVDHHGVINDCNPAFARMLGMTVKALEGRDFETLIDLQNRHVVNRAFANIEEGQRLNTPVECKLQAKEKEVYVQMFARKFEGKSMVLHFIDLTDHKTLEAQFVQSQKMQAIGQLAGGVAHDFNNLLTAMIGFCDLLILRHKAGDPSFNDIMQIKQNANRAANLVRQLLAFSRQQTLQARVLDVSETLTELSHLLHRLLGVGIELDVVHDAGLGLIKADEGQLEQVLINLAVNARDAMDGQGHLTIKTYPFKNDAPLKRGTDTMPAGKWVVVDIKDTGCGIDAENIERIFEPFFTTKEIGAGTGLGLSTVYGIIRQTGGFVHVESEKGTGTTFSIYLPEYEESEKEKAVTETKAEHVEQDLTGTATILLVEDEDAVRGFGARALQNKGYEVLEAACAEDALDIINNDKPALDMMITDVIMPEKDGPTLAREVLEMQPDLPVVFVSGYTEDRFKDEFAGYNVSFLPKPFTLKQLAEKVKETMDSAKRKKA